MTGEMIITIPRLKPDLKNYNKYNHNDIKEDNSILLFKNNNKSINTKTSVRMNEIVKRSDEEVREERRLRRVECVAVTKPLPQTLEEKLIAQHTAQQTNHITNITSPITSVNTDDDVPPLD